MGRTVTVVVNQQQAQMLDRLVREGIGITHAEVISEGFKRFCETHPALVGSGSGAEKDEP